MGFLKPRFRKAFRLDFENNKITIFDYEKTTLVSITEANKIKKELKSKAIKLNQIQKNAIINIQPEEILSTE